MNKETYRGITVIQKEDGWMLSGKTELSSVFALSGSVINLPTYKSLDDFRSAVDRLVYNNREHKA
jgi:hypothetical protein